MPGTVTVIAARPGFGRAGHMKVSVDGTAVGRVRQGASLELTLDPGVHRFRVSVGGCRSKNVELSVGDDDQQHLFAGPHPGASVAMIFVAAALGLVGGLLAVLPVVLIFIAVPGLFYYLRVTAQSQSAEALEDVEEQAVAATSGEPWWVNDPNLAKRYRKG